MIHLLPDAERVFRRMLRGKMRKKNQESDFSFLLTTIRFVLKTVWKVHEDFVN